jgi:hypothetical protein
MIKKINELEKLRINGIITEEEFVKAKLKIILVCFM